METRTVSDSERRYGLAASAGDLFPAVEYMDCMCLAPAEQEESGCLCTLEERALRHCIAGKATLTPEQRKYCHDQIVAVEGYSEDDTAHDDVELCCTVLHAWTDYCRDKGML
jgi:hypothetical protein